MGKMLCLVSALASVSVFAGANVFAGALGETVARFEALGMPNVAGTEFAYIAPPGSYVFGVMFKCGAFGNAWMVMKHVGI